MDIFLRSWKNISCLIEGQENSYLVLPWRNDQRWNQLNRAEPFSLLNKCIDVGPEILKASTDYYYQHECFYDNDSKTIFTWAQFASKLDRTGSRALDCVGSTKSPWPDMKREKWLIEKEQRTHFQTIITFFMHHGSYNSKSWMWKTCYLSVMSILKVVTDDPVMIRHDRGKLDQVSLKRLISFHRRQ